MQTGSLPVIDFSGGITDNFIDNAFNKYEVGDNILVTSNKKAHVREGSIIFDETYAQIPAGAQRIGSLFEHDNTLLIHSAKKVYWIDAGWNTLAGPSGNDVFTTADTTAQPSWSRWTNQVLVTNDQFTPPMKIYTDNGGTRRVRNAGLPKLASTPSLAGTAGSNSYNYAFFYSYAYQVGTVSFNDFGAVTLASVTSVNAPDVNQIDISAIPVIANGVTDNYDTTVAKVQIYRTANNGTVYYLVGEITNGTTIYTDTLDDTALITKQLIYTEGGVLSNDPPPLSKYLHVANGICWYGNIKTASGELISNRIRQSIQDDPDSCPETLFIDLEDTVSGISSFLDRVVVGCANSIYRLDGVFDELGQGAITYQQISETTGCISHNSMVQIPDGVLFAGIDGFYYTDGFKCFKISEEFNTTYATLVNTTTQKSRIHGRFDRLNKRVYWTIQTDSGGSSDVDKCFVLDLRFGIKPDSCFTTISGTYFAPTAIHFFNNQMIRGDTRGYIFKHDPTYKTDPLIDTTIANSLWGTSTIVWDYKSCASSFGNTKNRKFIPNIVVDCKNDSNLSLQIISLNDTSAKEDLLSPIRFRGNLTWGDEMVAWGEASIEWNSTRLIEEMRRFKSQSLRCSFKQIKLTNAYTIIYNSDALSTATIDTSLKTATLTDTVTFDWPSDMLEYKIYFANDAYTKAYDILSQGTDTLTFLDPQNAAPSGAQKWVIKGYPKGEIFHLIGYTYRYSLLGETQTDFATTSVGSNA